MRTTKQHSRKMNKRGAVADAQKGRRRRHVGIGSWPTAYLSGYGKVWATDVLRSRRRRVPTPSPTGCLAHFSVLLNFVFLSDP
ncbi:hypothetical protein HanIR_Chr02g0094541 [Helianthus annuus]|nr:hypothetical protein HanIR_Chr02g0094531 [Helianthus annuus]KAJ0616801.1 hypothetical protein HanIR_Chr02g0094541 [Helianthus annuus]